MALILIGLGGFTGAISRYLVDGSSRRRATPRTACRGLTRRAQARDRPIGLGCRLDRSFTGR